MPFRTSAAYCETELDEFQKSLVGDEDAVYMKTMTYKAEDFVPVMACPSQVDKIRDVSELQGETIDQVFIGSCTNGRLELIKLCLTEAAVFSSGVKSAHFAPASIAMFAMVIRLMDVSVRFLPASVTQRWPASWEQEPCGSRFRKP